MKLESKFALIISLLLLGIFLVVSLMMPVEILADATNTTVIQVNISEVSAIEVNPTSISWTQVAPGGNSSLTEISVKNTGSSSFAQGIFVSVDSFSNTTFNPTDGDVADKYMAGSFFVIANSTTFAIDEFWFVNQISWNETTYPQPTNPTSGAISWGFYHNKSNSWLWELKPGLDGTCLNWTSGSLKVMPTVDTGAGSRDLSTAIAADPLCNSTEWLAWGIASGPLKDYVIASSSNCQRLMIYKYDLNSSLPNCGNRTYLAGGTFSPGVTKYFQVKVHVPKGVPAGTVANSTVTFTADAA